jgi:hypothetical protein
MGTLLTFSSSRRRETLQDLAQAYDCSSRTIIAAVIVDVAIVLKVVRRDGQLEFDRVCYYWQYDLRPE